MKTMDKYIIKFKEFYKFDPLNFDKFIEVCGLYFIFLSNYEIQYPFGKSRLIYIGMSEKKTNSIGRRLFQHYFGASGNIGLINYKKLDQLYFTYLNYNIFREIWPNSVEDLENYFICDFVGKYGVYPICNNKLKDINIKKNLAIILEIKWDFFERGG